MAKLPVRDTPLLGVPYSQWIANGNFEGFPPLPWGWGTVTPAVFVTCTESASLAWFRCDRSDGMGYPTVPRQ